MSDRRPADEAGRAVISPWLESVNRYAVWPSWTFAPGLEALTGNRRMMGPWLPALALLFVSVFGGAWLEFRPKSAGQVAAFFPPWWSGKESLEAVAAAGGAVVRFGGLQNIVVVASSDPALLRRLHAAGAVLLLDPVAVGGCVSRS
jgi:hypothetical protein